MPFEHDGFMAPEVDALERDLRARHAEIATLFVDTCRLVLSTMREVELDANNGRSVLMFGLAARIVEHCQGTERLAFRGMRETGRATLRCALECLFALVALARAKVNYRRIRLKYLIERRNVLQFCVDRNGGLDLDGNDVVPVLNRVRQQINRFHRDNRRVTVAEMARLAHMTDVYEVRYNLYSAGVHPDPIDIAREHAPPGAAVLRFEPSDDIALQLREAIETLGKTAHALIRYFALNDAEYARFVPRLQAGLNA
jgi:hypothetical protein